MGRGHPLIKDAHIGAESHCYREHALNVVAAYDYVLPGPLPGGSPGTCLFLPTSPATPCGLVNPRVSASPEASGGTVSESVVSYRVIIDP